MSAAFGTHVSTWMGFFDVHSDLTSGESVATIDAAVRERALLLPTGSE